MVTTYTALSPFKGRTHFNNGSMSNVTEDGRPSITETYFLAAWSVISTVLGGGGNLLIIIAIWKKRFELDHTSLWFLLHISLADLCYIIVFIIPSIPSNIIGRWLFGDFLCVFTTNVCQIFAIVHLLALATFSLNKFLRCMFPLKALYATLSKRGKMLVAAVIWTVSCVPTAEYYVLDRGSQFDTSINRCFISDRADSHTRWFNIDKFNFLFFSAVPVVIVIISNLGLVAIVFRSSKHALRATTYIVLSLAVLLLPSWIPVVFYAVTQNTKNYVFYRVVHYTIPIDSTLSPLAYCWLNDELKKYIMEIFCCRRYDSHPLRVTYGSSSSQVAVQLQPRNNTNFNQSNSKAPFGVSKGCSGGTGSGILPSHVGTHSFTRNKECHGNRGANPGGVWGANPPPPIIWSKTPNVCLGTLAGSALRP